MSADLNTWMLSTSGRSPIELFTSLFGVLVLYLINGFVANLLQHFLMLSLKPRSRCRCDVIQPQTVTRKTSQELSLPAADSTLNMGYSNHDLFEDPEERLNADTPSLPDSIQTQSRPNPAVNCRERLLTPNILRGENRELAVLYPWP